MTDNSEDIHATLQAKGEKPRKRQRLETAPHDSSKGRTGRHSKSCSNCRRLKVKCEANDEIHDCSRCARLGLSCLREKKSWIHAEDEAAPMQLVIVKLERALEDVLEKLNMPALDLYASPSIVRPRAPPRATRPNSEEPVDRRERPVSPDPMSSLIEATRLDGLRSQLRSVKLRRKGGMRRRDHDLISEQLLTTADAEQLLAIFQGKQSTHLLSATISQHATVNSLRASSTVLFTAVMLVASLLVPGKEAFHETCHGHFMGLVASVMFDRVHTLDDIRGLCIAAFWEPYLSWKLSGLCIRMATELNLHHAFHSAFYEHCISEEDRKEHLERARLWYLLYVLDHQSSIAYGRPPVMSELRPIKEFEMLLNSDLCTSSDRTLIAQVTGLVNLSRAFDTFGLEPKRAMTGDDASVLDHSRFADSVRIWRDKWNSLKTTDFSDATMHLLRSVELQYHFSNLVLNSLVLRGRSPQEIDALPVSLRPLALRAVEAAHSVLEHFLDDLTYAVEIAGMPLYLHSIIAFSAVFLMKLAPRWHHIGITIDPAQRTLPLVERIVRLLQHCQAGSKHMVYSMAKGFERMLQQIKSDQIGEESMSKQDRPGSNTCTDIRSTSNLMSPRDEVMIAGASQASQANELASQVEATGDIGADYAFEWGMQDEELWSLGMGYDLLEPFGLGIYNADFTHETNGSR